MARRYAHFDHMTRGEVTDKLYNGTLSQVEHDAYLFMFEAMRPGQPVGYTDDALAIVREYLKELRLSGTPRIASHEDAILEALEHHRLYIEEEDA